MVKIVITNTLQDGRYGRGPRAVIIHQARLPPWGFHGNFQSWGHLPTLHLKLMSVSCIVLTSDRKICIKVYAAFTFFTSADLILLGALITERALVTMIDVPSCFVTFSELLVATIPRSWEVLRRRNNCQEQKLVEFVIPPWGRPRLGQKVTKLCLRRGYIDNIHTGSPVHLLCCWRLLLDLFSWRHDAGPPAGLLDGVRHGVQQRLVLLDLVPGAGAAPVPPVLHQAALRHDEPFVIVRGFLFGSFRKNLQILSYRKIK